MSASVVSLADRDRLARLWKWLHDDYLYGGDVDAGDLQETAHKLGLLDYPVPYDREQHGDVDYADQGDPIYVDSEFGKCVLAAAAEAAGEK